ncbi:phosphopantothenate-cysteine ligase [Enterococcus sp. AZ194]|uniref:phosphopantothenate--cysteine ligase n=1 Tax=Enterococcus sp. AZ194 TaxID=2774629 RepID=UPI003F1F66D7
MKQTTEASTHMKSVTKRVLVTAGGTSEPIDSVRSITNHSTGRLGQQIAQTFLANTNMEIDYITTRQAVLPEHHARLHLHYIESTMDLKNRMEELLTQYPYQAVIHSMAVSDFTPESSRAQETLLQEFYQNLLDNPEQLESYDKFEALFQQLSHSKTTEKKISSKANHLLMVLKQNPKIIQLIKQIQPQTKLVGFKLLVGVDKEELFKVAGENLQKNSADFVLANDLESITETQHIGYLISKNGLVAKGSTKQEIASLIVEALRENQL